MRLKRTFKIIGLFGFTNMLGLYFYVEYKKYSKNKLNIVFDLDETIIHTDKYDNLKNYNNKNIKNHDTYLLKNELTLSTSNQTENLNNNKNIVLNDNIYRIVWVRPFVKFLLPIIADYNNLFLFTKATKQYADLILEKTELDKYFVDKKYRNDCYRTCKDLSIFTSQINKIILFDDKISNQCLGQNFYHIPRFNYYVKNDFEFVKVFFYVLWLNILNDFDEIIKKLI